MFPEIVPDAAFGDQRLGSVLKRKQNGIKQNLRAHTRRTLRSVRLRHESPANENPEDRLRLCFVERFFLFSTFLFYVFFSREEPQERRRICLTSKKKNLLWKHIFGNIATLSINFTKTRKRKRINKQLLILSLFSS